MSLVDSAQLSEPSCLGYSPKHLVLKKKIHSKYVEVGKSWITHVFFSYNIFRPIASLVWRQIQLDAFLLFFFILDRTSTAS